MQSRRRWLKRGAVAGALLLAIGVVWAQQPSTSPVGATVYGDLNGDGVVDLGDVILALRITVGALKPEDIQRQGLPNGDASPAQVLHGRYIVVSSGCADCHNGGPTDPNDPLWLAGYTKDRPQATFAIGTFATYAANLTPDPDTGLGKWTPQQIFDALRTGKDPEGHYLCPPMPWTTFRNKSDGDLWSIVAYLRSIKPVSNAVPESQGPNPSADGHGDWSGAYQNLPPLFPAYPGTNEVAQ